MHNSVITAMTANSMENDLGSAVLDWFSQQLPRNDLISALRKGRNIAEAKEDAYAQTQGPRQIEEGLLLVKPEKQANWEAYVNLNSKDAFSSSIIDIALNVMKEIEKVTKEEPILITKQIDDLFGDTSPCSEGFAVETIAEFHERGEEFKAAWIAVYPVYSLLHID